MAVAPGRLTDRVVRRLLALRRLPGVAGAERLVRALVPPLDGAIRRSYAAQKDRFLERATRDPTVLAAVGGGGQLPTGYGRGMDERVVEYPWVLARLGDADAVIFDAGSTLNHAWVARHPAVAGRRVTVQTLAPEGEQVPGFAYRYGDLRIAQLPDGAADVVVCISTLEHVGMDNREYGGDAGDPTRADEAVREVMRELRRVLRPGGRLLLTVPFGVREDLGWLRTFDGALLDDAVAAFAPSWAGETYFRHGDALGWRVATRAECASARYVATRNPITGRPVGARATAVACVELVR